MQICIDATSLLLRSAGVKNYVYHWMTALQHGTREHTFTAFPLLGKVGELNHEASVLSLWQTLPRLALLHLVNLSWNPSIEIMMSGVDVFHASNQVRHPPKNTKLTGTLYDMTCLLMPQNHTSGNVKAEQYFAEQVLARANGLISISNNTRQDAIQLLDIHPEKIKVIYPGVAESFFQVTRTDVARVSKKYSLIKPYILFVGTVEPRKNLDTMLDAYQHLPESLRQEFEMVVVGPIGWAAGNTIKRLQQGEEGVRYLGYIPEQDLPAITGGATVFVYPSLYEGFGFPVAQSMAAGVPIITSNVSSLPEVAGEAALLIDPRSVSELRDAMMKLLTSPTLQKQLSAAGVERAKEYTWAVAARKSAEFFSGLR